MSSSSFEKHELPKKITPKLLSSYPSIEKEFRSDLDSLLKTTSPKRQLRSYVFNTPDPSLKVNHEIRPRSNGGCPDCIKNKSTMLEYKKNYEISQEKLLNTDKHLKQYDTLLNIKEKRLKEQELVLRAERDAFDNEKKKFEEYKHQENESFSQQFTQIQEEKELNCRRIVEIDEKYK